MNKRYFDTWKRIASRPRSEDFSRSFQAQIRDPLWFLSRQWQMGEFKGEDAASPYWVKFSAKFAPINGIGSSDTKEPGAVEIDTEPLIKIIEEEGLLRNNFTTRVNIGQQFEILLKNNLPEHQYSEIFEAYRTVFPLPKIPDIKPVELLWSINDSTFFSLSANELKEKLLLNLKTVTPLSDLTIIEESWEKDWKILDLEDNACFLIRPPKSEVGEFLVYKAVVIEPESLDYLGFFSGKVMDGLSLLHDMTPDDEPIFESLKKHGLDLEKDPLRAILSELHKSLKDDWVKEVYGTTALFQGSPKYWSPEQLEFQTRVSVPSPQRDEHLLFDVHPSTRGQLDWYSFDQISLETSSESSKLQSVTMEFYPGPVVFNGMPDKRWWRFEKNDVDFGSTFIDESELDRVAFVSFLTKYSNDWFVVPFIQKSGTLCRIDHLIVCDVFGGKTLIERTDKGEDNPWTMFTNTITQSGEQKQTGDYFFLPPPNGSAGRDNEIIEEVFFKRDEIANYVWGIEKTIESELGHAISGGERATRGQQRRLPDFENIEAELRYILMNNVRPNWIPFIPMHKDEQQQEIVLQKGTMVSDVLKENGERITIHPVGKILNPNFPKKAYVLWEEEVPQVGVNVSRVIRRMRWINGKTHLWVGRNVNTGEGGGSSNLRFDNILVNPDPPR